MDNKFTVIKGGSQDDITSAKQTQRVIAMSNIWQRQFDTTLSKSISEYGYDMSAYPQEDLMKIALAGIKFICSMRDVRREEHRLNCAVPETLEESKATFSLLDCIFGVMGNIKLKNLLITFPVKKDFDGHKWESKDYFYTMEEFSKLDMEKAVGRDYITELLWDYENDELRHAYIDYMTSTSAIYRSQTGKGIAEEFFDKQGVRTQTIYKNDGLIQDNITGQFHKMRNNSRLKVVK